MKQVSFFVLLLLLIYSQIIYLSLIRNNNNPSSLNYSACSRNYISEQQTHASSRTVQRHVSNRGDDRD